MENTIVSTLKFAVVTNNYDVPKSEFLTNPVVEDGIVSNLPEPQEGVLFLVNLAVFTASDREDLICFDNKQTIRDEDGRPIGQGGFIRKDGTTGTF